MVLRITNRMLERTLGFSHPQIKRWAVAFLDPDPSAGQHSGKIRTYSFDEAVKLSLGGYLVRSLKFNLKESAGILNDITSWLNERGWPIFKFIQFEKDSKFPEITYFTNYASFGWIELFLYVARGRKGFMYKGKEVIGRQSRRDPENETKPIFHEKYRLHYFGDNSFFMPLEPFKEIHLSEVVNHLASFLCKMQDIRG